MHNRGASYPPITLAASSSPHREQATRNRTFNLPSVNPSLPERQYSDEFEEPIRSFTEQDENGEEPSISHDGSRVLEDLLAQVGKAVLPSISSSDDDEDQLPAGYTSHHHLRQRVKRVASRHTRGDGELSSQRLFFGQDSRLGRRHVCSFCDLQISSRKELEEHMEWHARRAVAFESASSAMPMDLDDETNFLANSSILDDEPSLAANFHRRRSTGEHSGDLYGVIEVDSLRSQPGSPMVYDKHCALGVMPMVSQRGPTMLLDIPRDITNMVFDYLHPMDWTRSCALVNKFFRNVSLFKWGRVEIYALQGLSSKKQPREEHRAAFLGQHATRLKTLIIENCGIQASSFISLTANLRRLQVLVLEWSPRVLMDVVQTVVPSCPKESSPPPSESPRTSELKPANQNEQEDTIMEDDNTTIEVLPPQEEEQEDEMCMEMKQKEDAENINDEHDDKEPPPPPKRQAKEPPTEIHEERIDWESLDNFPGQLRVVIVRGIGPHISSSAFRWLLSNSHQSLQHLTISRKDPTRCQRPGCGACTLWKFQACAQCKMATYCSRRCQKRHWRNHKSICQECAKSPRDRMVFDDILLGSIIQCANLIRLDLSRTFRLDDRQLVTIAQYCTKLIDVSLDGNHHISDRGVAPFVRSLPKLHTLRLNVCSHIGNQTIEALSETCADHLTVLELGCCYRVSESALMDLVVSCTKLQSLNIACGFQRRQILWNFSDELALLILDHLVHLKVLYVVSTISLSDEVRRKLDEHENLRVYSALTLAPPLDPPHIDRT